MARIDALAKVTGTAAYAADVAILERVAVAIPVTSSRCRCRIAIDDTEALKLPGVLTIVTYANAPRLRMASAFAGSELGMLAPLQDDRVTYAGQCVAIVVASDMAQAEAAAAALRIDHLDGESDVLVTLGAASRRDEADYAEESRCGPSPDSDGGGLVVVDEVYLTAPAHHNPMEPGSVIAKWDEEGSLLVRAPVQWAEMAALTLAQVFGLGPVDSLPGTIARVAGIPLAHRRVRVEPTLAGGSFGRNNSELFLVLAAMAAKTAGRPVALHLSRQDTFTLMPYRAETRSRIVLAADRSGRLASLDASLDVAMGAVGGFAEPTGEGMASLYACPKVSIYNRKTRLDLNAPGWMRAPGLAPGLFALETAMDELAGALRVDPLDLRLKNYAEKDPATGRHWTSKSLRRCYEVGAAAAGWTERGTLPTGANRLIGHGMASAYHPNRQFPGSAAVALFPDGRVRVGTAVAELGQGATTAVALLAAETLGVPLDAVDVAFDELGGLPAGPAFGSAGTLSNGAAVIDAAQRVKDRLRRSLRRDPKSMHYELDDIDLVNGRVVSGAGQETLVDALSRLDAAIEARVTRGRAAWLRRRPSAAFGAVFASVEVDPATGEVQVSKIVGAYACGRVVDPAVLRGQLAGGIVWGIGQALMERTYPDPRSGMWINRDLGEALVPTHADVPDVEVILVEEDDGANHRSGIKGGGEIGVVGTAAAIVNAIYDATGLRIRSLPIRPEDVAGPLRDRSGNRPLARGGKPDDP